jgi:hypothetical protein
MQLVLFASKPRRKRHWAGEPSKLQETPEIEKEGKNQLLSLLIAYRKKHLGSSAIFFMHSQFHCPLIQSRRQRNARSAF